jgi:hypothetical protein
VEIGVHMGVDLIHHNGRYFPIELNLYAGLKRERRVLYPEKDIDPIFSGICRSAAQAGYQNVLLFHHGWYRRQEQEFHRALQEFGLQGKCIGLPYGPGTRAHTVTALPEQLPERTFCIVFHSQHQPIDYLLADKSATSQWLQQEHDDSNALLGTVRSSNELFIPPLDESEYWPNLVIKFGGMDRGANVVFAKVRNESEALQCLRFRSRKDHLQLINGSWLDRVEAALFHRDHVVFQEFIPPEITAAGRACVIRAHFVFTPLRDIFLSAHLSVPETKPPEQIPFGLVPTKGLIANLHVDAHFERLDEHTEEQLSRVAPELGQALRKAACARFITSRAEEERIQIQN